MAVNLDNASRLVDETANDLKTHFANLAAFASSGISIPSRQLGCLANVQVDITSLKTDVVVMKTDILGKKTDINPCEN